MYYFNSKTRKQSVMIVSNNNIPVLHYTWALKRNLLRSCTEFYLFYDK